jgi:hypothetical protein
MSITNAASIGTTSSTATQSTQSSSAKKIAQDFNTLAQALGSSDKSGAQNAFASLLQDLLSQSGATQQHHRHHHHGGGTQHAAAASATTASAPTATHTINTTA